MRCQPALKSRKYCVFSFARDPINSKFDGVETIGGKRFAYKYESKIDRHECEDACFRNALRCANQHKFCGVMWCVGIASHAMWLPNVDQYDGEVQAPKPHQGNITT